MNKNDKPLTLDYKQIVRTMEKIIADLEAVKLRCDAKPDLALPKKKVQPDSILILGDSKSQPT